MTDADNVDTPPPHIITSIDGIRRLSASLSAFLRRYDELNDHLGFITSSIHSNLPDHLLTTSNPNQSTLVPLPETSSSSQAKTFVREITNPNGTTTNCEQKPDNSKNPENPNISNKPEPEIPSVFRRPALSNLDHFCQKMCGRGLKRYVATNVSDAKKLREELPKSLKFAKDPAKLVFESIGRFYVQGSNAYTKDSTMVSGRLASVIILECFLLMNDGGIAIAKTVEEDAEEAAVEWRQRIKNEGGIMSAEETDARGLLLLISGFGIPAGVFKTEDIRDLIRVSNVKEISAALRSSKFIVPKIPEVINQMVKDNMEIEAVDIVYSFGLEDKCSPQSILTTFLRYNTKNRPHGSSAEVKEAIKKQLADLKSIIKCLEAHKVDPSKLLPDWNLNEKLQNLQKEISELDLKAAEEKATQKRKAKEAEYFTRPKHQESKRPRLTGLDDVPQEQKAVDYGRLPSDYTTVYSTSTVLRGSRLPKVVTSSVAVGSEGGLYAGGLHSSSYGTDVYGGTITDKTAYASNVQPYDCHEGAALIEKYLGRTYLEQSQTYDSQPSTADSLIRLYSRPQGFGGSTNPGSPVGGSARGSSASDLYRFADSVVASESYLARGGSGAAGSSTLHPYSSPRRSSYLY